MLRLHEFLKENPMTLADATSSYKVTVLSLYRNKMEHSVNPDIFPAKLWQLANDCNIDAITWNHQGDGIIINANLIEKEFLSLHGFKASSFSSVGRQLRMYEFKKYQRLNRANPKIHHYFHPNVRKTNLNYFPFWGNVVQNLDLKGRNI